MNNPQETNEIKRMGLGMQVLAWLTFLGLGVFFFSDVLEKIALWYGLSRLLCFLDQVRNVIVVLGDQPL